MKETNSPIYFKITNETSDHRLDQVLTQINEVSSRSRAQKLIELGMVSVNGKPTKSSYLTQIGDEISVTIPVVKKDLIPLNLDLDILHEDDDVAVVFKPAGLVVHPANGHLQDTLVNILLDKIKNLSMGFNEQRPGIVHRLDKETSGLLVIAKNDRAHQDLSEQFRSRSVKRIYNALVYGTPKKAKDRIVTQIGRDQIHRKKFRSVTKGGKLAITNYEVFKSNSKGVTELRLRLETGRTHQIRVHVSEMGHPILGDQTYGSNSRVKELSKNLQLIVRGMDRIALHAAILGFKHPTTGKDMVFERDWPPDIQPLLEEL